MRDERTPKDVASAGRLQASGSTTNFDSGIGSAKSVMTASCVNYNSGLRFYVSVIHHKN